MVALPRVKSILTALAFSLASATAADDPAPDAHELLRNARITQSAQVWKLRGQLRVGSKATPFRLVLDKGAIRYEFGDTGDSITLRLSEKGSTLEEKKGGKTAKVTLAKFDAPVRDTDISYEDLALRFLYWNDAKIAGGDIILTHKCWKVEVLPPPGESQYTRVMLWIGRDDGALMKAESFDSRGNWVRKFTVRSVMKRDGYWLLKQMRIEHSTGRKEDPNPTYLEIDDVEK